MDQIWVEVEEQEVKKEPATASKSTSKKRDGERIWLERAFWKLTNEEQIRVEKER